MWLLFSILSPVFWSLSNPIDAALRKNFVKDDMTLTWFFALLRLPIGIFLVFFLGGGSVANFDLNFLGIFLAGTFWVFPFAFYFKALKLEDATRVVLLMQTLPIFTLLIAAVLLGESLNLSQFGAFLLILIGGFLAAFKKTALKWSLSQAFWWMMLAVFCWAASDVLFKYFQPFFPNFWMAFGYYVLGGAMNVFLMLLFSNIRKSISENLARFNRKGWFLLCLSAANGIAGSICFAYALTLGKASLTAVIIGIQPLLTFIFGHILSKFFKEVEAESLKAGEVILKFLSLLFILAGLIYLHF